MKRSWNRKSGTESARTARAPGNEGQRRAPTFRRCVIYIFNFFPAEPARKKTARGGLGSAFAAAAPAAAAPQPLTAASYHPAALAAADPNRRFA